MITFNDIKSKFNKKPENRVLIFENFDVDCKKHEKVFVIDNSKKVLNREEIVFSEKVKYLRLSEDKTDYEIIYHSNLHIFKRDDKYDIKTSKINHKDVMVNPYKNSPMLYRKEGSLMATKDSKVKIYYMDDEFVLGYSLFSYGVEHGRDKLTTFICSKQDFIDLFGEDLNEYNISTEYIFGKATNMEKVEITPLSSKDIVSMFNNIDSDCELLSKSSHPTSTHIFYLDKITNIFHFSYNEKIFCPTYVVEGLRFGFNGYLPDKIKARTNTSLNDTIKIYFKSNELFVYLTNKYLVFHFDAYKDKAIEIVGIDIISRYNLSMVEKSLDNFDL